MVAAAVTLALFGFTLTLVIDVLRRDGGKIVAALEGKSWTADKRPTRSVTTRFSQPVGPAARHWPEMRAAA